jgi:hypothetical protein
MPVEILPHWTFPANWRTPVVERLEWRSAVLASVTGAEQSFATRMSPRRTFEALVTPNGTARTRFDLAVGDVGVDFWYVPLWHDAAPLDAPLVGGVTEIPVDTTGREYAAGGFVMLTDAIGRSEVAEIDSVAPDALTLVEPTDLPWPVGTIIYPAIKARLTDQPSMSRRANRTFEGQVRFIAVAENDFPAADSLTTYLGLPVLTVEPNEATDLTHAYERIFDEIDGDVGLVQRSHTSSVGFTVQGYNWWSLDRAQRADLRALFYYMQGRNNPVWLPTFAEDFDVVSAGTGLTVKECGFTFYGGPRENRQDVQIVLHDGTILFRRIESSTLGFGGVESLVFDTPLSGISAADIRRVSFMSRCRMSSDNVDFNHLTDGVSQAAAQFRTAPDTRSVSDYADVNLGNTTPDSLECGAMPPGLTFTILMTGENMLHGETTDTDGGFFHRDIFQTLNNINNTTSPFVFDGTEYVQESYLYEELETEKWEMFVSYRCETPNDQTGPLLVFMPGKWTEIIDPSTGLPPVDGFTSMRAYAANGGIPYLDGFLAATWTRSVAIFPIGSPPPNPEDFVGGSYTFPAGAHLIRDDGRWQLIHPAVPTGFTNYRRADADGAPFGATEIFGSDILGENNLDFTVARSALPFIPGYIIPFMELRAWSTDASTFRSAYTTLNDMMVTFNYPEGG